MVFGVDSGDANTFRAYDTLATAASHCDSETRSLNIKDTSKITATEMNRKIYTGRRKD